MQNSTSFLEVVDSGIDYITATHSRTTGLDIFNDVGRSILHDSDCGIAGVRPYHAQGYRGLKGDGISWGIRYDGAIIRLSGDTAKSHWLQVFQKAQNVSRLDLQVTVNGGINHRQLIETHWREITKPQKKRGRPIRYTMIKTEKGASGLNVGARSSEKYLRIYHKGDESGQDCYQTCVRYEAELKSTAAAIQATAISEQKDMDEAVRSYTARLVAERGLTVPFDAKRGLGIFAHAKASARESSIVHIATCIQSFIKKYPDVNSRTLIRRLLENHLEHLDVLECAQTSTERHNANEESPWLQ